MALPAPAELDDDVVGLDGAEDALDVGDGVRGEVRGAEDPHLVGLHEVRRAPRRDRAEPPPRDAHERAGLDQPRQRGVPRGGGARVGEHGRPVVEARRRRRDRRPERRRRGGWGGPRCHPGRGRSAARLGFWVAGGARAAARRGEDMNGTGPGIGRLRRWARHQSPGVDRNLVTVRFFF